MDKAFIIIVLCVLLALSLVISFKLFKLKELEGMNEAVIKRISKIEAMIYFIAAISFVAIFGVLFTDTNLYRVKDVYDDGVGVRCLTDNKHSTTTFSVDKDKIKNISDYDLINRSGDVVISSIWFSSEAD